MLSDLMVAVPAALLAGVLPGWFWTRVLLPSTDLYERIAYSTALSLVLVPSVILVPTRLFGAGVSLGVALASPLVVFLGGLLAYARFGGAKGTEGPIAPSPAPLRGVPAQVLLIAAFGLVLGILLGVVPGGWVAPVLAALLTLFAGVAHLLASRRPNAPRVGTRDPGSPDSPAVRLAVLSAVLLLVLLRGYLGPLLHGWPYPGAWTATSTR